ncbi:Uncharacterised protein [Mycobacterium tuberculosis]|nr:Uncharacterised protein [Mycobacterium tuberculosis]
MNHPAFAKSDSRIVTCGYLDRPGDRLRPALLR